MKMKNINLKKVLCQNLFLLLSKHDIRFKKKHIYTNIKHRNYNQNKNTKFFYYIEENLICDIAFLFFSQLISILYNKYLK